MRAFGVIAFALVLAGCGQDKQRVGREFTSMRECLEFIEMDTREPLKIFTDKPGDISGKTAKNGLSFRCELMSTGTRGLVLEGRWDRLKK